LLQRRDLYTFVAAVCARLPTNRQQNAGPAAGAIVGILLFRFLHIVNRGEIFIWNHSKNNNVSPSHADRLFSLLYLAALYVFFFLSFFLSLSPSLQRATPNKTKRNPVIFCLCRPMIPSDMMAPLSVPLRSLAVAARVYHHAYKSVREDQIGFQKYKIHGDIKKRKGGEPEHKKCGRKRK